MAFLSNLHTHTRFSDGKDRAEEYVQAAIGKGFVSIGFSEHGYTSYDGDCCIKREDIPAYRAEIAELKEKYRGQIEIYLGVENDYYQPMDREGLDFTIGSVHYLREEPAGKYHNIDYEHTRYQGAMEVFGGIEGMARHYYGLVADMALRQRPDIIGHLDLIGKLNGDGRYYDPASPWYRELMEWTAERLAESGCIVEVNTGAISRGYLEEPSPNALFLPVLFRHGVEVTLSSDAHRVEHLDFAFGLAEELLRKAGYRRVKQLRGGTFVDVPL